ncbi:hypothetical protein DYI20_06410 [Auritidibacter ignavus]|nr:hypothetical protein [Auritidibacter ignavus]RMX23163.1 hypothetical protein DYI20_06410 [Auritidibacter ignavus]
MRSAAPGKTLPPAPAISLPLAASRLVRREEGKFELFEWAQKSSHRPDQMGLMRSRIEIGMGGSLQV